MADRRSPEYVDKRSSGASIGCPEATIDPPVDSSILRSSGNVVRRITSLMIGRPCSAFGSARPIVGSIVGVPRNFLHWALGSLILHGTLDKNTRPSGSQHFYDMAVLQRLCSLFPDIPQDQIFALFDNLAVVGFFIRSFEWRSGFRHRAPGYAHAR